MNQDFQKNLNSLVVLFKQQFNREMDAISFLEDDFYAGQILIAATAAPNGDLREVAQTLNRHRIALQATQAHSTKTAELLRSLAPALLEQTRNDAARRATGSPGIDPTRGDSKRTQKLNLTGPDLMVLSKLANGMRRFYGARIDLQEFAGNDVYARLVLDLANYSGSDELVALAHLYFDESGTPAYHRRGQALDPFVPFIPKRTNGTNGNYHAITPDPARAQSLPS